VLSSIAFTLPTGSLRPHLFALPRAAQTIAPEYLTRPFKMTDVTANNEPFDYASLEWLLRFHEATEPVTTIGLLLQWILLQIRYNAAPFRLEGLRRNCPNIHLLLGEPPAEDRDRILAPCAVDPRDYPRGVLEAALLHNAGLEAMMYLTPLVERFFSGKLSHLCQACESLSQ
jgi:hypothetical protein